MDYDKLSMGEELIKTFFLHRYIYSKLLSIRLGRRQEIEF
ncbi:hypothetical protein NIES2104_13710 [Leptolyngbya sp. NIES-2104]|nr:hypothetical protein NIES2104_13710 [Leptolyngbya sp. NIES-2104]